MIKSYQDKKLESSVKGFNHLTLSVKDISRSLDFYENQLGFTAEVRWATGAYLSYGDAWLCLSLCSDEKEEMSVHYTHYAFNIDTASLKAMRDDPALDIWQVNQSEGDSLYVRDPDGHQLEFHLGSLSSRLTSLKETPYQGLEWLS
nr:VOC family protein [Marinomonas aquiplantarum]